MHNKGSVMNGLHRISGKIAEASRPPVSAPPDKSRADSSAAPPQVQPPIVPPAPPVATPAVPPVATPAVPPVATPAAPPVATPAVPPPPVKKVTEPRKTTSGSLLGDALLRRYEDYLKTRRDLAVRIVRETESLRIRQEELQREAERIRTHLDLLERFAEETAGSDESVNPGDQAAFAAECRKIEHIRLELFRIAEQADGAGGRKNSDTKNSDAASLLPLIDSLTFGQLAKAGFAFFFPLLVTLVLITLILAAAVILSFNGMFVW